MSYTNGLLTAPCKASAGEHPLRAGASSQGKLHLGQVLPKEFGNLGGGLDGGNVPTSLGALGLVERPMGMAAAERDTFLHPCAAFLPHPLLKHRLCRAA